MIDSAWFYGRLKAQGKTLEDLARALRLDPGAASRLLRGEQTMSAEEQDALALYLGVSLEEVAARRRGRPPGFAEDGQETFQAEKTAGSVQPGPAGQDEGKRDDEVHKSFYERVRGKMAGTVTIAPGVDLTEPTDPDWARVYDDDDDYPLHL